MTDWLEWFLRCLLRAIRGADGTLSATLGKAAAWEAMTAVEMNRRQKKMLRRLVDGFDGRLTAGRWQRMTDGSRDTALRDINDLIAKGLLVRNPAGGRGTSYDLAAGRSVDPLTPPGRG